MGTTFWKLTGVTGLFFALSLPVMANDTGLANIHLLRYERGKLCMADHFHFGEGRDVKSKKRAQKKAIASWADFVAMEYGTDWARFRLAGSKSIRCRRDMGAWQCDVQARPCRRRK